VRHSTTRSVGDLSSETPPHSRRCLGGQRHEIQTLDLQHTCASLPLAQGVHPRVMETLGHSQISITMDTRFHVMPALGAGAAQKMNAAAETRIFLRKAGEPTFCELEPDPWLAETSGVTPKRA